MASNPSETHPAPVLVVEPDAARAQDTAALLGTLDRHAMSCAHPRDALDEVKAAELAGTPLGVVLTELHLPQGNDAGEHLPGGLELVRTLRRTHPTCPVVIVTAYPGVETAVEAMRLGAADYLSRPLSPAALRRALGRADRLRELDPRGQHRALNPRHATPASPTTLGDVIGQDPRMLAVYRLAESVAPAKTTVLMHGESGTGKSLIAGAIHRLSPRRASPFIELSCGSIPESLLESELFGHVKGAFTGAHADKVGRFQAAHGGTIFLDEINSASPAMQLKLLRVLQERRFEPVGSSQTIEVDVRVILASNQPLEDLVARGMFRQDLYYRIAVVQIDLPPLRDRPGDIDVLAEHFLQEQAGQLGRVFAGFSSAALAALRAYAFPGNVRELSNVVERAAVLARGQTIQPEDLPPHVARAAAGGTAPGGPGTNPLRIAGSHEPAWDGLPLEAALREPERRILLAALEANLWNRQATADALGINRTTLYKKMKTLGIDDAGRAAG